MRKPPRKQNTSPTPFHVREYTGAAYVNLAKFAHGNEAHAYVRAKRAVGHPTVRCFDVRVRDFVFELKEGADGSQPA